MRLLMLVLLALPLAADEVTFYTSPPGAEVWVHRAPGPGLHNPGAAAAEASFLGHSGQPITLDLAPYLRQGRLENLQVDFRLEHHKTRSEFPNNALLEKRRWPSEGSLPLEADSAPVAAWDFAREHWGLTAVAALGLPLVTGAFLKQRRALARERERNRRREELTAGADRADPFIERRLGRYLVVDRLGAGGMAVVYRAVPEANLRNSQAVAIKVISPQMSADAEFRERFLREVRTYQKLSHPNIVRIVEWGDTDPMYLAMELVEGSTLRQHIPDQGLSPEEAVALMYPLLDALSYAHEQGIVHRDLKPENVMLGPGRLVKVMDFGLARPRDVSRRLTASGTALGTPDYMSPEQINGATAPSCDQYSLGIMFFELLCGRVPFEGDIMGILLAHMSETAPPLSRFREGLPQGLEALVARMIERDPGQRFPSLREPMAELERLFPRARRAADPFPAGTFDKLLS